MEYIVFKDFSLKSKEQLDFFSQNDPYVNIKYGEEIPAIARDADSFGL